MFQNEFPLARSSAAIHYSLFFAIMLLASLQARGQFSIIASDTVYTPHFLRYGMEKVANTFIFNGIANAVIAMPKGELSINQSYRGAAIRSGGVASRDDEQLAIDYSLPLNDSILNLTAKGFWMLSKDSRDIGLSSLSQAGGVLGAKWRVSRKLFADFSTGVDQTIQLGKASTGSLFGLNARLSQFELGDFTGDFMLRSAYSRLEVGRENTDIEVWGTADRQSENGGIAKITARYKQLGRDYYLPIGFTSELGIESRLENKSDITAEIVQPITSEALKAEIQIQLGNTEVSRRFFAPIAGAPLTSVKRGLSEFTLNVAGALRLSLANLQLYGGTSFSIRDESNGIRSFFNITAAEEAQLKQSEFQRDNSSSKLRLFGQALWKASSSDTARISVAASILRYDTPSAINYDDRDELLVNAALEVSRRFTNNLAGGAGISMQFLHTVFIKTQRSAQNNQNRVLKFFTRAEFLSRYIEIHPQFETLANYTAYDFDGVVGARSFSFRQMSCRDSIILRLGRDFHLETRLYSRYFLAGHLDWNNFIETPQNTNYEQFAKILIFTHPSPNISLAIGARGYVLSQHIVDVNAQSSETAPALRYSYGPETLIDIRFKSGTRIAVNGWYERQFTNHVLTRNLPNIFLTAFTSL